MARMYIKELYRVILLSCKGIHSGRLAAFREQQCWLILDRHIAGKVIFSRAAATEHHLWLRN